MVFVTDKKVLITRPKGQEQELMRALTSSGWECFHQPLLTINAIEEGDNGFHDLKNKIMNIDLYDMVITVSSNASSLAYDWIDQYWPQLPVGIEWFAVGPSSASPLKPLNLQIQLPQGNHSEGLVALPELQSIQDKNILILRGVGGREYLAQTLTERGAKVSYAELYHRQAIDISDGRLSTLLTKEQIHYALVTSGEMAVQLAQGLTNDALKNLHLLIPSERIKKILADMDMQKKFSQVNVCPLLDSGEIIRTLDSLQQQN